MDHVFFSDRVLNLVSEIKNRSITLVEAPTGYGKTTAVNFALKEVPADKIRWLTCTPNTGMESFSWFKNEIKKIDEEAGNRLSELGPLNRINVVEISEIISAAKCDRDEYIVIDNFQHVYQSWPLEIFIALTKRKEEGLHVIFLSQNLGRLRGQLEIDKIIYIGGQDLKFSEEEVINFADREGVLLEKKRASNIYKKTEGWPAAVSLVIRYIKEEQDNQTELVLGLDKMLEDHFWSRLGEERRKQLLSLSIFDTITLAQINYMLDEEYDEVFVQDNMKQIPLVYYNEYNNTYTIHELLSNFLRKRFMSRSPEFIAMSNRKAGVWFKEHDEHLNAFTCFYIAGDYDSALGCDLTGLWMEKVGDEEFVEVCDKIMDRCARDLLAKHPVAVLKMCHALFAGGKFKAFKKHMKEVEMMVDSLKDEQILGEYHLVRALSYFPDCVRMTECYEEARNHMSRFSEVFVPGEPFMFGSTSMWNLYYREPGRMMETVFELQDMLDIYNTLTDDHGAGGYELYFSEVLSVQCRFEESDILAHRAFYLAEEAKNVSMLYGATLILGINAIYQSNMVALEEAVSLLESKANSIVEVRRKKINEVMVESVRSYLLAIMMETNDAVSWAKGDASEYKQLTFANCIVKTCRITDLLLRKEYKKVIGNLEASLFMEPLLISQATRNFMYVGLALSYLALGRFLKAGEYLSKALSMSEVDQNYSFIAAFRGYFSMLFILPEVKKSHENAIVEIKKLDIHYNKAEERTMFGAIEKSSGALNELSPREREIAEMVAKGMRNKEIAANLFVSEETVKSHIKNIFTKCNIDRRSKIVELLK